MRKKRNFKKKDEENRDVRNNGRNSRGNRKGNGRNPFSEDPEKSSNDPAWYAADPTLLRDAASIPFSWPTGNSKIHDDSVYSDFTNHGGPFNGIPGVLSFLTVPCIGKVEDALHPVNVAAQSTYSFVRHANSGHSNYDASDLMLYIMAMANMYSYLVWCQRLYGYALTYDQRNRYLPGDLIRTNNVDTASLINNLANFRFWMNTIISKMASFAVPATMSIFQRMSFLYSDLYCEGTIIKDQLYQFVPDGFFKFKLDPDDKGMLEYQKIDRSTLMTVNDVMSMGDDLFSAIWEQEDFGIMSGDILKAYGDRIIKLMSIPEAYIIAPKFDAMVLTQMKNARLLNAEGVDITQSGNIGASYIVSDLKQHSYTTSDKLWMTTRNFTASDATIVNKAMTATLSDYNVLTVDTDNPTPEVVIEATRLKYGYDKVSNKLIGMASEFIKSVIVTEAPNVDIILEQLNACASDQPNVFKWLYAMEVFRSFHYLPEIRFIAPYNNAAADSYNYAMFDIDNFAVLDNRDLQKMNEAAVINMYAVPSVGKVL